MSAVDRNRDPPPFGNGDATGVTDPADEYVGDDQHAVYENVVTFCRDLVRERDDDDYQLDPGSVGRRLKRRLNVESERTDRIAVDRRTGNADCDLVVDDSVGVTFLQEVNGNATEALQKQLGVVTDRYDYLIVYGDGIDDRDQDLWRTTKRAATNRFDVRDVTVVEQFDPAVDRDDGTESAGRVRWAFRVIFAAVGITAAVPVALELWAFLTGAGSTTITFVVSLLLVYVLALALGAFKLRF